MKRSELKREVTNLMDTLAEYRCDYRSILYDLDQLQQVVMEGIEQEKVSAKDGVLTVTEKYPEIVLGILKTKLSTIKDIAKFMEKEEEEIDQLIELHICPLEDRLL